MNYEDPFENTHWVPIDKDKNQILITFMKDGKVLGLAADIEDGIHSYQEIVDLLGKSVLFELGVER